MPSSPILQVWRNTIPQGVRPITRRPFAGQAPRQGPRQLVCELPLHGAAVSEKIVPVTSGVLVATQQIVKCLAISGTEPKVNPAKSVPQVAEANAEAELTVALRTAFHSTSTDQADFAMPAIGQRKRSRAGLPAASSCQRGTGEDAGYQ
jgi:hypothetical protein